MKKFRYQQRQKRKQKNSSSPIRLILHNYTFHECNSATGYTFRWSIAYQDPAFHNGITPGFYSFRKHYNNTSYQIMSLSGPNILYYHNYIQIYLLGTTSVFSDNRLLRSSASPSLIWKALDFWAREYNWPSERIEDYSATLEIERKLQLKNNLQLYSPQFCLDNTRIHNPSNHTISKAGYMVFRSPKMTK